jgi:hypothetical protein
MQDRDYKKSIELLKGIDKKLSRIYMGMNFNASDMDEILKKADLKGWLALSDLGKDPYVLEAMAEYLRDNEYVKISISKDGVRVLLTNRGYAFIKSGGFTADKMKKEKEKRRKILRDNIFHVIIPILLSLMTFFLGKFFG